MPLFACSSCNSVENTALSNFWASELDAYQQGVPHKPKCSACDPAIGIWHGEFERRPAAGYHLGTHGFLYSAEEVARGMVPEHIKIVRVL